MSLVLGPRTHSGAGAAAVAALLAIVLGATGCRSTPDPALAQDGVAAFLGYADQVGYETTEALAAVESPGGDWKMQTQRVLSVKRAKLRSTFPAEIGTTLYYRFDVEELTFANSAAALSQRLWFEERPTDPNEDGGPDLRLERVFADGPRVIRVSTGVRRFADMLETVAEDIESVVVSDPGERARKVTAIRGRTNDDLTRRLAQDALARVGLYDGPIDGIVGRGSKRAIRAYRARNGLSDGNELDAEVLESLGVPADPVAHYTREAQDRGW